MTHTLAKTKEWFEIARPATSIKDLSTQMGVHFEEVAEMIENIEGVTVHARGALLNARFAMEALSNKLKEDAYAFCVNNNAEMLDALCDQTVTATGVAHCLGYKFIDAMDEVNRSNFSKFVDNKPVYNDQKKVIKGPNYVPPRLRQFT